MFSLFHGVSGRSSVEAKLAQLDQELDIQDRQIEAIRFRLEETGFELERSRMRRDDLMERRLRLVAELAPVSRLPYEILSHIFVLGNEEEAEPEYLSRALFDIEEHKPHFPTVVSHVNRRFREVAITTAALWTYIDMREGAPYEKTKLWMERAKGQPLDINLDFTEPDWKSTFTVEDMHDVIITLQPPSRWRSFALRSKEFAVIHEAMLHCLTSAPRLRELELVHSDHEYDEEFDPLHLKEPVDLFSGDAPLLDIVVLYGVHLRWDRPMLSGLRVLELEYHTDDVKPCNNDFLAILRSSPALERLVITASGPNLIEPQALSPSLELLPADVVRLEALEELELGDMQGHVFSYLIRSLITPKLRFLAVDSFQDEHVDDTLQLINASRYPALRQLKIVYIDTLWGEFMALLRRLPDLVELELNGESNFLEAILQDDGDSKREGPLVLPKLQCLRTGGVDGHLLAAFVEQRKRLEGQLQTVLVKKEDAPMMRAHHLDYLARTVTFGYFEGSDRGDEDTDEFLEGEEEEEETDEEDEEDEDGFENDDEDSWTDYEDFE